MRLNNHFCNLSSIFLIHFSVFLSFFEFFIIKIMDYPILDAEQLIFLIPSGVVVSGASGSGKNQLVMQILDHAN